MGIEIVFEKIQGFAHDSAKRLGAVVNVRNHGARLGFHQQGRRPWSEESFLDDSRHRFGSLWGLSWLRTYDNYSGLLKLEARVRRKIPTPDPSIRRHDPTGDKLGATQAPRLSSRLPVAVAASRRESQALTSFSQNVVFFAPFGLKLLLICAQNAHNLQHSKSATSFVFKYFLASFPLFSIFCSALLSPSRPEYSVSFYSSATPGLASDKMSQSRTH